MYVHRTCINICRAYSYIKLVGEFLSLQTKYYQELSTWARNGPKKDHSDHPQSY